MADINHLSEEIAPKHWRIIIRRPWGTRHSWLPGLMDWYCSLLLTAINNFRSRLTRGHVLKHPSLHSPTLESANSSLQSVEVRSHKEALVAFEVMFMVHHRLTQHNVLRYREEWNTSYGITELSAESSFGYGEPAEIMKLLIVLSCFGDPSPSDVSNPGRFRNRRLLLIVFIFLAI